MNVYRRNGNGLNESFEVSQMLRFTNKAHQSSKKASKIKQAIKNIITQTVKLIGKTLTAAVLTSIIIIATDLIDYANSTRPQFAIGGEWLMILFIFIGWMFVIDWILGKKRKPHTTK